MRKKQINTKIETLLQYFFIRELGGGFLSKNRNWENVKKRRFICIFLAEKGFSKKQISRVIRQNHSLVFHLLKEVIDKEFEAYYKQKTAEFEEKFQTFCEKYLIVCKSTPKSIPTFSPHTRAITLVKSADYEPTTSII